MQDISGPWICAIWKDPTGNSDTRSGPPSQNKPSWWFKELLPLVKTLTVQIRKKKWLPFWAQSSKDGLCFCLYTSIPQVFASCFRSLPIVYLSLTVTLSPWYLLFDPVPSPALPLEWPRRALSSLHIRNGYIHNHNLFALRQPISAKQQKSNLNNSH